jgi:hypothetical protein
MIPRSRELTVAGVDDSGDGAYKAAWTLAHRSWRQSSRKLLEATSSSNYTMENKVWRATSAYINAYSPGIHAGSLIFDAQ